MVGLELRRRQKGIADLEIGSHTVLSGRTAKGLARLSSRTAKGLARALRACAGEREEPSLPDKDQTGAVEQLNISSAENWMRPWCLSCGF